jgi:hypothetical protein
MLDYTSMKYVAICTNEYIFFYTTHVPQSSDKKASQPSNEIRTGSWHGQCEHIYLFLLYIYDLVEKYQKVIPAPLYTIST